jgi:hypothetical protein
MPHNPTDLNTGTLHAPAAPRWMFTRTADGPRRSLAWVFYAVLSLFGAIGLLSSAAAPAAWLVEAALIAYTGYLYRGGRWVVFFWV